MTRFFYLKDGNDDNHRMDWIELRVKELEYLVAYLLGEGKNVYIFKLEKKINN